MPSIARALSIMGLVKIPSTMGELLKRYRRLCLDCHPDRLSGSEERFKEVGGALEVLRKQLEHSTPKKSLWSKGKAKPRMVIRGSVGRQVSVGHYVKATNDECVRIDFANAGFVAKDTEFEQSSSQLPIKMDVGHVNLVYLGFKGKMHMNEKRQEFICWNNGNVWFKAPDNDTHHSVACECQDCRLYKHVRLRTE